MLIDVSLATALDSTSLQGVLVKLLLLSIFTLTAHAKFSRGSNLDYVVLEGVVSIKCPGRKAVIECRDTFLEPWPYDIFVGPKVPDADLIEIRSENKSNTTVAVADYDGNTGRSSEFNLGVYSLFQKPLLRPGYNKLTYHITSRQGRTITSGSFEINVGKKNSRRCETRETHRNSNEDCAYTYTVCQQYFRSLNYCR